MLKLPGHGRYAYSPIIKRPGYEWPGGKRLAFYVALNIEHFAFGTGLGMDPSNRSGQQTTRNFAWRDYGNRIGNWRLFEMLDQLKLPATILLNSSVCYNYPDLVEKIKARGDDVLGHGRTNAELLRPMWEQDEARAIEECTAVIEKYVGVRPTGWMGPGALESSVTPDLLKEAGYTHLLDWPFDDQPIWMQTRSGPLLSVPYPMELNDAGSQAHRDHTGREFGEMIVDQFEEMLEQSERQPLVFALALHGFIVGQPFRLRPVRQAIKHCVEHKHKDRVWYTRAGDIAKHCFSLPKGLIPGRLRPTQWALRTRSTRRPTGLPTSRTCSQRRRRRAPVTSSPASRQTAEPSGWPPRWRWRRRRSRNSSTTRWSLTSAMR